MDKTKNAKTISLAIVAVCISLFCLPIEPSLVGLSCASHWLHRLSFHFFHANIFHLAINCWAMLCAVFVYGLPPWHLLIAFAIGSSFPSAWLGNTPTIGLSAMVFALFGLIAPMVLRKLYYNGWMAFYIIAGIALPSVNGWLHLYCYIIGYIIGQCLWLWKRK